MLFHARCWLQPIYLCGVEFVPCVGTLSVAVKLLGTFCWRSLKV